MPGPSALAAKPARLGIFIFAQHQHAIRRHGVGDARPAHPARVAVSKYISTLRQKTMSISSSQPKESSRLKRRNSPCGAGWHPPAIRRRRGGNSAWHARIQPALDLAARHSGRASARAMASADRSVAISSMFQPSRARPISVKQDGDGIGFLARGAGRRPDAQPLCLRARAATRRGSTGSRRRRNSAASRKKLLSLTVMASVTASASASRPSRSSPIRPAMSLKSKRRITGARRRVDQRHLVSGQRQAGAAAQQAGEKGKIVGRHGRLRRVTPISASLARTAAPSNGFMHIFIGAGRHGAGDLGRVAFGGAEQDDGMAAILLAAHALDEFHALHGGQVPVQENQVGHLFAHGAQAPPCRLRPLPPNSAGLP